MKKSFFKAILVMALMTASLSMSFGNTTAPPPSITVAV
jgi:hypothetical protein